MPATDQLFEILEGAYKPCFNFNGACANACTWDPISGLVPCAFGGALGELSEVKLIIVTAEPGDPPKAGSYSGSERDMVSNSMRIFLQAMSEGGIDRPGRPTPFHRNMRVILDLFWPRQNLDSQMRKTWFTNAVLCPAKISGGAHPKRVELACVRTYLAKQLAILPNAFIFALGTKSVRRMSTAGLKIDASGYHPSSRVSKKAKISSWAAAAETFHKINSLDVADA